MRWHLAAVLVELGACASTPHEWDRDSRGQFTRSKALRAAFMRANPCPATGASSVPCDGRHVHHHVPRHCDGPDTVENLQWITHRGHRAFHAERSCEP